VLLSQALCVIGSLENLMFKLHTEPSNYVLELIFVVNIKFLRASYHTIEPSTEELYCLNRFLPCSVYCLLRVRGSDWLNHRALVDDMIQNDYPRCGLSTFSVKTYCASTKTIRVLESKLSISNNQSTRLHVIDYSACIKKSASWSHC